jgi:cyclopropane fatty-acyl-phospholipid synthase-like methyltransferase
LNDSTTRPPEGGRRGYWEQYYESHTPSGRRQLPSQFATFVAGELGTRHRVVEFGCGSGRDSLFFASYGHDVVGIDASEHAVAACRALAAESSVPAEFVCPDLADSQLLDRLAPTDDPVVVYARFFIHAITDDEEQRFLDLASQLVPSGGLMAVEYRTVRDASGQKVTAEHFRRFVSPSTFDARALSKGFDVSYSVEGFGFAKYRQDDAYVARTVFVKR